MTDFRTAYYERYVSTFKRGESRLDDRALRSYWRWCEHRLLPLLDQVPAGSPVLELGCGPGYVLELLGRRGFRARGIDISAEQVALARERGLEAEVADVLDFLQGEGATWNAIVALDFIEHFRRDEIPGLLAAIRRRLVPGGSLLLQTPNGSGLMPNQVIYGDLTHLTIFAPSSLSQALELAGFEAVEMRETGPIPVGLKGRVRSAAWTLVRTVATAIRIIETGKRQRVWTENLLCRCRRPV